MVEPDRPFDVLQAASVLGVSGQYVRRLLQEGDRYLEHLEQSGGTDVAAPKRYLIGERKRSGPREPGPMPWRVSGVECEH